MARTVRDAALLLEVLAGRDPADAASGVKGARFDVRYVAALDPGALKGARIGVPRPKYFGNHPATDALAEEALKLLKAEGAILVDPAPIATAAKIDEPELEVLLYEFKADLEAYLSKLGGPGPRTLKALIEWNQAHAAEEMPLFGQELFIDAEKKGPLTTSAYRKARAACIRLSRKEGIDATMDRHKLDALVAPTQGPAWLIDWVNGDSSTGGCSSPAAVAGYPHVTVPMGQVRGLPVGLSFFGRAWSEARLLALAYAYEQASHARKPPTFAASAILPPL
jgi:amidase